MPSINFGQIWVAKKDYLIRERFSQHFGLVIPKATRIIVLHAPLPHSEAFSIMPLTKENVNNKLFPNLKEMELRKEGYGINIFINEFLKFFVLDKDQSIVFEDEDARKFWQTIKAHH